MGLLSHGKLGWNVKNSGHEYACGTLASPALKFKISKNHALEAASYPVWSVMHIGSLWLKAQFAILVPCLAGPHF